MQRYDIAGWHWRVMAGWHGKKSEIMRNLCDSHPFSVEERVHLEFMHQLLEDGRAVDDLLILQVAGQVDTVVLADILHRLRGQEPGMREDTHRIEDMPSRLEITGEGTVGHAGQSGQLFLADEFMLIVKVDHKNRG